MKIEDLKVGKKYSNASGTIVSLKYIGRSHMVLETESGIELVKGVSEYSVLKPLNLKKRYWIWDVKTDNGIIRSNIYMCEQGKTTKGERSYSMVYTLIKKYEDLFIDVEEDTIE
jgi:hypothetical protein